MVAGVKAPDAGGAAREWRYRPCQSRAVAGI